MLSVGIYPIITKVLEFSLDIVFDNVEESKEESESQEEDHQNRRYKNDDIFGEVVSAKLNQNV